jgi:hypothetical protein
MIDEADCVVVLLTSEGLASREVSDEISRAHQLNKLLIPVTAEGTNLEALPWFLRDLHWIRYNSRNFDDVIETLVKAIRQRAAPLATVDRENMPKDLETEVEAGVQFIDVPLSPYAKLSGAKRKNEYLYYRLKMRATNAVFVFRVSKFKTIGSTAEYLVAELLPHLEREEYELVIMEEGSRNERYLRAQMAAVAAMK